MHYEAPVTNVSHQALQAEMQRTLQEYRETEQKHLGYTRLRDADVLRALVFLVRMAHGRSSGRPRSRAFVDFIFAQFLALPIALPSEAGSRIVMP